MPAARSRPLPPARARSLPLRGWDGAGLRRSCVTRGTIAAFAHFVGSPLSCGLEHGLHQHDIMTTSECSLPARPDADPAGCPWSMQEDAMPTTQARHCTVYRGHGYADELPAELEPVEREPPCRVLIAD